jgi:hypothetical protein
MHPAIRAVVLAIIVVLLSGTTQSAETVPLSAERFVAAWADAWSRAEPHDAARFYAPDVAVSYAQPDLELTNPAGFSDTTTHGEGRAWLASWMAEHSDPHTRLVTGVFVAGDSIATTLRIDDLGTGVLVLLDVDDEGRVSRQTTLRWRDARKPSGVPDPRLAGVDDAVAERVAEWADGQARLAEFRAGDLDGSAVFVVPGLPTEMVAFVVEVPALACRSAVVAAVGEAGLLDERRFADSSAPCPADSASGSPAQLRIPAPLEEQVTGWVTHPNGSLIPMFNSTAELENLASWGLSRFAAAGLEPPAVDSFTFAPVEQCSTLSGIVVEGPGRSHDLVLCTDAFAACRPDRTSCTGFDVSARFGLLHELAHAWLADGLDAPRTEQFLSHRGLQVWRDAAAPWHERGVEHAAEIVAWGLMDEDVPLVRLGDPPCSDLAAGYALVTGTNPQRTCSP